MSAPGSTLHTPRSLPRQTVTAHRSRTGFTQQIPLSVYVCVQLLWHTPSYTSHLLTWDTNIAWDTLLLSYYAVSDIFGNNPASPDISSGGCSSYTMPSKQPVDARCVSWKPGSQCCLSGAMIRLGLHWLQSCWLQYTVVSQRPRGQKRESLRVGMSVCQAVKSDVAMLYPCV